VLTDDDPQEFHIGGCACLAETAKAILVRIPPQEDWFEEDPVWIPKSQLDGASDIRQRGDAGALVVRTWWAWKNGWYVSVSEACDAFDWVQP
jgi:hypothetical protein